MEKEKKITETSKRICVFGHDKEKVKVALHSMTGEKEKNSLKKIVCEKHEKCSNVNGV